MSGTRRWSLLASNIDIGAGQSVDLPDGWPAGTTVLISYYGYGGIRSTYIGPSGSVNVMVASTATGIGSLNFNITTGKVTNNASASVRISSIYKLLAN